MNIEVNIVTVNGRKLVRRVAKVPVDGHLIDVLIPDGEDPDAYCKTAKRQEECQRLAAEKEREKQEDAALIKKAKGQ